MRAIRPSRFVRTLSSIVLPLTFLGCASRDEGGGAVFESTTTPARAPAASPPADAVGAALGPRTRAEAKQTTVDRSAPAKGPPPAAQARKIIYNAQVDLIVESISSLERELRSLNKQHGAFISETEIDAATELRRSATWKVRVPVERFDDYLAALIRLGELQRDHVNSQDVTEEFYDLDARIKNKQEEEKRLLKHLADSTGKLDDILTVERELSRVRGEVEQMQGRIQFLGSQSALSTITIRANEVHDYKPPEAPTFGTEIGRTFQTSVGHLVNLGKAIVIVVVAVAPWLPVALLMLLPLAWASRRRVRERRFVPPSP